VSINSNGFVRNLKTIAVLLAIMWIALLLSYIFPLNNFGIRPRQSTGLLGIVFAHFLHGGFAHLIGNSISLAMLGSILFSVEGRGAIFILALIGAISGAGTWLIGSSNSVHIGASGLIYGVIGYLLFDGIFRRSIASIAVSVVVFVLYGGAIWGVFPQGTHISWEMHLCGFLAGIVIAKLNVKSAAAAPQSIS